MGHTLRSSIRTGRIDTDELGSFDIENSRVEVEAYETASKLVDQYSCVDWVAGDPGAATEETGDEPEPGSGSEDADSGDDLEEVPGDTIAELEDELATGDYDDDLDELLTLEEEGNDRSGATEAIRDRRDEIEE